LKRSSITASRLLAVIAAFSIVGAVAIATVMPATISLAQMVALADHSILVGVQDYVLRHMPEWVWSRVMLPVLERPAWLLPVSVGVIAAGLAVTLSSRPNAPHSRRKRS
jgi:hypothetical protein